MATPHIFINDFVGLPIIISDFDALTSSSSSTSTSTSNNPDSNTNSNDTNNSARSSTLTDRQHSTPSSASSAVGFAFSSATSSALQQNWATGFSDFADDLWAKMTQGMKEKLREACVEVLRKTEDVSESGNVGAWQYDDDARFLD